MSGPELSLVPWPAELERLPGQFTLAPDTTIVTDEANRANAAYLRALLAPATGFPLPICSEANGSPAVRLSTGGEAGPEGYVLTVTLAGIDIAAQTPAGVFYGIQTLRQLLPPEVEQPSPAQRGPWCVPALAVRDRPRFSWRGFMLDEARHFHGLATVLRLLDVMALHKLSVLHWHLTDDQGWRIEIGCYPKLTEVGAWRRGTPLDRAGRFDERSHGGFYTQAEIRQVVAYAAERHIQVVPEVEMPGHMLAALASYPELSCAGGPFEVACRFGILEDICCAGKESSFAFTLGVLDEVMALFPSPFIHTGGDEAPKARWAACPDCQRRIAQEGLRDEDELQAYFTNRIAAHLEAAGRRLVGWNEILDPRLAPGAVAQFWRGNQGTIVDAMRGGRDVVVSATVGTYLDYPYTRIPLSRAYEFEPAFPGLAEADQGQLLGIEAPLWTEWVPTRARLDYQAFPRLSAIAETSWTQRERKDLSAFMRRLAGFLCHLDALGIQYAPLAEVEPQ